MDTDLSVYDTECFYAASLFHLFLRVRPGVEAVVLGLLFSWLSLNTLGFVGQFQAALAKFGELCFQL